MTGCYLGEVYVDIDLVVPGIYIVKVFNYAEVSERVNVSIQSQDADLERAVGSAMVKFIKKRCKGVIDQIEQEPKI